MPTKYGMPPTPDGPMGIDDGAQIDEPKEPPRPKKKYGRPPKPDDGDVIEKPPSDEGRKMPTKYGKAPKPSPEDPLGG